MRAEPLCVCVCWQHLHIFLCDAVTEASVHCTWVFSIEIKRKTRSCRFQSFCCSLKLPQRIGKVKAYIPAELSPIAI